MPTSIFLNDDDDDDGDDSIYTQLALGVKLEDVYRTNHHVHVKSNNS